MLNHGIIAIIIKDDKYLLLKDNRELMLNHWGPPHGRCKPEDENEESCIIREVFEETNLRVEPIKKLWTTKADVKIKTISFWLVKLIGGEIKIDKKESSQYGWFTLEECFKLKLYPGAKRFFELVRRRNIII